MGRTSTLQRGVSTRDRILNAAILRFSRQSYEETGLRDIAADVGVDVAYVHRSFGSKELLFAEAVEATIEPARLLASSSGDLAAKVAKEIFARDAVRARDKVGPLDIIIHSLSSPEASRVLQETILKGFIDPLAQKLDHPAKSRAALIAAFLVGVGILRSVLGVEPLIKAKRSELEPLIVQVVESMMNMYA